MKSFNKFMAGYGGIIVLTVCAVALVIGAGIAGKYFADGSSSSSSSSSSSGGGGLGEFLGKGEDGKGLSANLGEFFGKGEDGKGFWGNTFGKWFGGGDD